MHAAMEVWLKNARTQLRKADVKKLAVLEKAACKAGKAGKNMLWICWMSAVDLQPAVQPLHMPGGQGKQLAQLLCTNLNCEPPNSR
jgi:hypothetical protein